MKALWNRQDMRGGQAVLFETVMLQMKIYSVLQSAHAASESIAWKITTTKRWMPSLIVHVPKQPASRRSFEVIHRTRM